MKIEETIVTGHIDLKKLIRRQIQVSADLLTETARYGQNVARILLEDGETDNKPLKHNETEECILTEETAQVQAAAEVRAEKQPAVSDTAAAGAASCTAKTAQSGHQTNDSHR